MLSPQKPSRSLIFPTLSSVPTRGMSSYEAFVYWPGWGVTTFPTPFLSCKGSGGGSRCRHPTVLQHLGGWRELPPAALTAFKGTARNRCGHPTACMGLAASECPFSRLCALRKEHSALAAWFFRGESSAWPLVLALYNVSSHLSTTQHSSHYPDHLLAAVTGQPDAEATDCSVAAQHRPNKPLKGFI